MELSLEELDSSFIEEEALNTTTTTTRTDMGFPSLIPRGRTYAQVVAQGEPRSWTYQVGLTGSGGPGRIKSFGGAQQGPGGSLPGGVEEKG
ncbi:hypothetical protein EYF80_050300 [Liparis tanakae]|uniref:Uncharacterized protein n=1 Tax=Liparis tanakae TaxID=230148 RepID=A0A4Z2FFK7_9TELE|nr:hypothetical protein EYF80_050300 [Liparis tanakae]